MGSPAASICIAPFFSNLVATAAEQEEFPAASRGARLCRWGSRPGRGGQRAGWRAPRTPGGAAPSSVLRQGWGEGIVPAPPSSGFRQPRAWGPDAAGAAGEAAVDWSKRRAAGPGAPHVFAVVAPGPWRHLQGKKQNNLGSFLVEGLNNLADSLHIRVPHSSSSGIEGL